MLYTKKNKEAHHLEIKEEERLHTIKQIQKKLNLLLLLFQNSQNISPIIREKKNPNLRYLPPTLNLSTMYSLYNNETHDPVSLFVFRDVFRKKFNLSFHAHVSDSCRRCDEFEQKIKSEPSEATLAKLKFRKRIAFKKGGERPYWSGVRCGIG